MMDTMMGGMWIPMVIGTLIVVGLISALWDSKSQKLSVTTSMSA